VKLLYKVQRASFTEATWLKNITWAYEPFLYVKGTMQTTETCTPFETQVHANSVVAGDKVLAAFG
jgi:hypothetical protein